MEGGRPHQRRTHIHVTWLRNRNTHDKKLSFLKIYNTKEYALSLSLSFSVIFSPFLMQKQKEGQLFYTNINEKEK